MKKNTRGNFAGQNILIPETDVTDTTPVESAAFSIPDLMSFDGLGMQFITTGTLVGEWLVEVSNDYVPETSVPSLAQPPNAGHWSIIDNDDFTPPIAAVSAASSQPIQLCPFMFRFIRVTFTPASGTGTVVVTFSAKGTE